MYLASNPTPDAALTPKERVNLLANLLDGELSKSWVSGDKKISISTTTDGFEVRIQGIHMMGNDRHYYFALDGGGNVVRAEGKVQMGCLLKELRGVSAAQLDQTLVAL